MSGDVVAVDGALGAALAGAADQRCSEGVHDLQHVREFLRRLSVVCLQELGDLFAELVPQTVAILLRARDVGDGLGPVLADDLQNPVPHHTTPANYGTE
ncbi:hypothetical protein OG336_00635 [[Kitasatospora] papulosa]|uniref:hypothetical protein n=1 Tax=[Kitasatospora] papulosa TaxID=1464011 RepID=UPI002E14891F|nr:hypothetical protein OG336_00635 [[Kitasatospora] papulosa]